MAVTSICARLGNGLDFTCLESYARKYYQQIVIINSADVDTSTVVKTITDEDPTATPTPTVCAHKVEFSLLAGKTGYRLAMPEAGNSIFGSFDKVTNELTGGAEYIHKINYSVIGVNEQVKCLIRSLDKGSFIVAAQLKDGTVEIFGLENGLQNADYTFDPANNNGGATVVLQSLETAPETQVPFVYDSADPNADFDGLFANP